MKPINFILWISTFTGYTLIAGEKISVETAAKKGLIKLVIKGKGGYTGNVIAMNVKNLTNQNLELKVEPGRRLDSKVNSEQDVLVVKKEEIFLAANQEKNINVYGMCCQAHNSSPKKDSEFLVGKMGDSLLIKLASFIDSNKYYASDASQDAVWAISDNYSIAGISGADDKETSALRNYVSKITGRPIPKYNLTYCDASSSNLRGHVSRVDAVFNYTLTEAGRVAVNIYDSNGNLVQVIQAEMPNNKGEYVLYYVFRTRNLSPGTYYTRMLQNGEVKKEDEIEF